MNTLGIVLGILVIGCFIYFFGRLLYQKYSKK
jgi:glycopeptide antibiotics resistance protein